MSAGPKTLGLVMAGDIEHRRDYRAFLRSISQVFTTNSKNNHPQQQQTVDKSMSNSNLSSSSQNTNNNNNIQNNNNNNYSPVLPMIRIGTTPDIFSDCQNINKPMDLNVRVSSIYDFRRNTVSDISVLISLYNNHYLCIFPLPPTLPIEPTEYAKLVYNDIFLISSNTIS